MQYLSSVKQLHMVNSFIPQERWLEFEVKVDSDVEQEVGSAKWVQWGWRPLGGGSAEARRQGRGIRDGVGHKWGISCNYGKEES